MNSLFTSNNFFCGCLTLAAIFPKLGRQPNPQTSCRFVASPVSGFVRRRGRALGYHDPNPIGALEESEELFRFGERWRSTVRDGRFPVTKISWALPPVPVDGVGQRWRPDFRSKCLASLVAELASACRSVPDRLLPGGSGGRVCFPRLCRGVASPPFSVSFSPRSFLV